MHLFKTFLTMLAALSVATPAAAETWHRADTHHFTIFSDGRASDLESFAHDVEKFDALMRLVFGIPPKERPTKLTIYMVEAASDVEKLSGRPNIAGFYRASSEGSFAVSNRQQTREKDRLSGRRTLFHEYAHHFMFNNFSIPAPAWFVEGFAEFVATAEFTGRGSWYFGKPAFHRAAEIKYAPSIPIETLLTVDLTQIDGNGRDAFYGWSWALTHMLYLESGEVGKQIDRYLRRINRGEASLDAARAEFGDLASLERALHDYVDGRMTIKKSDTAIPYRDGVRLTELGAADSKIVGLTLRRLGGQGLQATRDALAEASGEAGAEGWFQLGRIEYDLARIAATDAEEGESDPDYSAAQAAFDRALAIDPDHVHANVSKARILFDRIERDGGDDDAVLAEARALTIRANRADPYDPLPLYVLAESYIRRGERNDQVSPAIAAAFDFAPESEELRFAYAIDLANNGRFAEAIHLLKIIANDPHGGDAGWAAIRQIEAMRDGRSNLIPPPPVLDENGEEADGED